MMQTRSRCFDSPSDNRNDSVILKSGCSSLEWNHFIPSVLAEYNHKICSSGQNPSPHHSRSMEILWGWGSHKPKLLKEAIKLNWQRVFTQKRTTGGVWIFSIFNPWMVILNRILIILHKTNGRAKCQEEIFVSCFQTFWGLNLLITKYNCSLNPLTPGTFCQISFNLVENAFVTWQLALLATKITCYELLAWECTQIRILNFEFLDEKVTYVFRLFDFWIFISPSLFLFFFSFLLQGLTFHWACLRLKNFSERVIEVADFYHGAARCSGRKFCSEFFSHRFEHFCAYLRRH